MQITIPTELEDALRSKAEDAGFESPEEYVVNLVSNVVHDEQRAVMSPQEALERLRELRREVPRMTDAEIVTLVAEGRDRCQ